MFSLFRPTQILTRPSAANTNFPYHVRTSQIGILNEAPTGNQSHNVDGFQHHNYGHNPLQGNGLGHSPNFTELFTVSGSNNKNNNDNGRSSGASFNRTNGSVSTFFNFLLIHTTSRPEGQITSYYH